MPEETEDALAILRILQGPRQFYGIAGLMLVLGDTRTGKGLFSNVWAWKIRRYFKGIRILRDDHPSPIFGEYTLFDEETLTSDLEKMAEVAKTGSIVKRGKVKLASRELVETWQSTKGQVMMQKAVCMLDEYWRYMNNRRPMSNMNIALGGLNKMWGHTETLYIGIAQWEHDLDRFTCLPWVTHVVRCQMSMLQPGAVEAHLYHVKFNKSTERLVMLDKKPTRITIDGMKERPELGVSHIESDGTVHFYRHVDLYYSKPAPMIKYSV